MSQAGLQQGWAVNLSIATPHRNSCIRQQLSHRVVYWCWQADTRTGDGEQDRVATGLGGEPLHSNTTQVQLQQTTAVTQGGLLLLADRQADRQTPEQEVVSKVGLLQGWAVNLSTATPHRNSCIRQQLSHRVVYWCWQADTRTGDGEQDRVATGLGGEPLHSNTTQEQL